MNTNEYHSCYDELLSYLFNKSDNNLLSVSNRLTAHEIIIYSLLLHKCIIKQSEEEIISYKEIQYLRNKRCGQTKLLDEQTLKAYDNAIVGLSNKTVLYDIKDKRKRYKITYSHHQHPLLILNDVKEEENGNKIISYSLGPLGKTLIESKRYSTLVPEKYFQLNINETTTYQIALYICRIIFIERKKRKEISVITLKSVLLNINKFIISNNELISISNCYEYKGPNKRRLYNNIINKTNKLLETLLVEDKIFCYEVRQASNGLKWIIYHNNSSSKANK